jgi:hypothetical protein
VGFSGKYLAVHGHELLELEHEVLSVTRMGREAVHVRTARGEYAVLRENEVLVPYLLQGEAR